MFLNLYMLFSINGAFPGVMRPHTVPSEKQAFELRMDNKPNGPPPFLNEGNEESCLQKQF